MKRIMGHVIAVTAVAGLAATAMVACSHNDQSIFIRNVEFPPAAQGGAACTYSPDPTTKGLFTGSLDASLSNTYVAVLLVGNQLVAQQSTEQIRTESSRVVLQGAVVRITDSGGSELRSFTRLTSGFLDPSTGATPGYGVVSVELLDTATVQSVAATLPLGSSATKRRVAHVKVFGKTLGGQALESNEFDFPIDICNGCLVSFPDGSQDPTEFALTGRPNCHGALSGSGNQTIVNPCVLGQDQVVDCRLCRGVESCDPFLRATGGGG